MTDLQKIKAAPDRVAHQENTADGKVSSITWSSASLGLSVTEDIGAKGIAPVAQEKHLKGKE